MYKLPFKHRIQEIDPIKGYAFNEKDLAESIFGYSEQGNSLKGRVFFGHALADLNTITCMKPRSVILGGPKASYFPFYLKQFKDNGEYFTYDDINAILRGFKRYPVKDVIIEPELGENQDVCSSFAPLDKGAIFKTKVRFHNLKSVEIGALLSAITFHHNADRYSHNIGLGKPFGYGRVKVQILSKNYLKKDVTAYMHDFEEAMEKHKPGWLKSDRMRELIAMAGGGFSNEFLTYPVLSDYGDFKKTKIGEFKDRQALDSFCEVFSDQVPSNSILPLSVRLKPQVNLDLTCYSDYESLASHLNEQWDIYQNFTDFNKDLIYKKIKSIVDSKHRPSLKKLKKESHWDSGGKNILRWLGEKLMVELKKETGLPK
ncbi:hypothetical protein A3SI_19676 [Nitritalea halalkaliphila LW7]|uniref:Uncharacterized protein n=2 Tax=Nitritalea TaxID=1187887 RepID=I5BSM5_9BACT|nr:hypothetical protein A3SI_19676 [Nitritalea halalkaliphila LW7]